MEFPFARSDCTFHKPSHLYTKNGSRGTSAKKKKQVPGCVTHLPFLVSVAHHWSSVVPEQLGVALWVEVPEVIEEMIKNVGLRHLERRRLIAKLQASLAT